MTDDITNMLNDAVPEDSDPQGWGEIARKRSRRRRSGQIAVVSALAVAVAIPVGLTLFNPRETAVPAQSPTPTAVSGTNPCSELRDAAGLSEVRTPLDGGLPDGAVQAWLCGDANLPTDVGPAEPLRVGVADLVSTFNSLEPQPGDMMCTEEYRYTYTLVVDYPGDRKVVTGELHGCQVVFDGETRWAGGEQLLVKAKELWLAQRAAATPTVADLAACPPLSTVIMASAADVTAGFSCTGTDATISAKQLSADLVAEISATFDQGLVDEAPGQGILEQAALVLVDPWGSMISMRPLAGGEGFAIIDPSGTDNRYWMPGAELMARLNESAPEPDPAQPSADICTGALTPATTELTQFEAAYACIVTPAGERRPIALDADLARAVAAEAEGKWEPTAEQPASPFALVLVEADNSAHTWYYGDGRLLRYDADYRVQGVTLEGEVATQLAAVFEG